MIFLFVGAHPFLDQGRHLHWRPRKGFLRVPLLRNQRRLGMGRRINLVDDRVTRLSLYPVTVRLKPKVMSVSRESQKLLEEQRHICDFCSDCAGCDTNVPFEDRLDSYSLSRLCESLSVRFCCRDPRPVSSLMNVVCLGNGNSWNSG